MLTKLLKQVWFFQQFYKWDMLTKLKTRLIFKRSYILFIKYIRTNYFPLNSVSQKCWLKCWIVEHPGTKIVSNFLEPECKEKRCAPLDDILIDLKKLVVFFIKIHRKGYCCLYPNTLRSVWVKTINETL